MQSIFDRHKVKWTKLETQGYQSLAEMARRFSSNPEMDSALGYINAVSKWNCRADSRPSKSAERRAKEWLAERTYIGDAKQAATGVPPASSAALLLVACPSPDVAAKVQRVLAMLGCEVTEV